MTWILSQAEGRREEEEERAEDALAEKQGSQSSYCSKLKNTILHYWLLYYVQLEKLVYMVTDT